MKMLGFTVFAGAVLAFTPTNAQPIRGEVQLELGFGPPPCAYRCGPRYEPLYTPRRYGPRFYGPPHVEYRGQWRPRDDRQQRWSVTQSQNETDFELPDSVLFGLDSAVLSTGARDVITEIADAARERLTSNLVIEGYTDTSGSRAHNQTLSDERSRAVARELERQGVNSARLRSVGFGETRLAISTPDEVREPRNRRVVVRLIGEPQQAQREYGDGPNRQ